MGTLVCDFETSDSTSDSVTTLRFQGAIDEDANLSDVLGKLTGTSKLRLDLSGVTRINSIGVREWVNFVRNLSEWDGVVLVGCAPVIVSQLNMIANFVGSASVESVYAPYVCDECGAENSVLIDVRDALDIDSLAVRTCDKCEGEMELDDLPESYFAFAQLS